VPAALAGRDLNVMSRAVGVARLVGFAAIIALCVSCAPAPIYRPIKGGDVDTGTGTLEDVRQQLKGTWALLAYEVYENGKPHRLPAQGQMTYDEFGNLKLVGQLKQTGTGAAAAKPPMLLNYSGRAVIDVRSHELRLLDVNEGAEPLPGNIADAVTPANVRKYDLKADTLALTVLDAKGQPTASSSWKRQP
jgi:hypothetical protein